MRDPDGDGPTRTCIATRATRGVDEMIRFVAAPDGMVTPDLRRKLPGRGVWVTASSSAVAEAVKTKAFARGLKTQVKIPDDLPGLVGQLLRAQALQALSLANKAGAVICGAAKIEGGAGRGYAALAHAAEASVNGIEKLERAVRGKSRDGVAIPAIRLFTGDELSLSLGREHVVHAALVTGAPARNFLARARAAERYRPLSATPAHPSVSDGQGNAGICISTKDSDPDE